ncbi:uncharacterized protein LOC122849329 [Aphidius gifuensis]|uniref:uncharacterized protein LOC122849329 n=1 Tax=Aphidius gifuensis TaxID=684658 RepID=UPI001CDB6AD2|nr:uncharacterized protein LOC122849329 [Aphidius gifuensis]
MNPAKRRRIEEDQQVSADDTDKKIDLINSLDNDSLAQIFMLLPISERITMDQVCSKWKEACQLAWYDIKKYKCTNAIVRSYEKCILTQSYVEKVLFYCGVYLKELILSKICDSSIMPVVAKYCKNLTTLEFEIIRFCSSDTSYFVQAFTQLKQLKILKIHIFGEKIYFQILNNLSKDIEEIHLYFTLAFISGSGINSEQFLEILNANDENPVSPSLFSLREFTNLRSLTIRCQNITDIIQEISKKTTLVYLDLQQCHTENEIFTFNQLSNLEHLNIKDVYFWDSCFEKRLIPNPISDIFNTCKKLKHLDAPDFDVDLAEIKMENWVNLRNLVYIYIRWQASNAIIKKIIKYCNNLEFINIDELNSESIIELTKLENLNHLDFEMTNIDNEVMVAILNNCKKLKHLVIYGSRVEASLFDDLSNLLYIENLNLEFSKKLGDSAMIAIAANCKLVKCLNIENCQSITSTGYTALTSLKNLKELNVKLSKNVEDNFIVKLKGIKILNCSHCNQLTDAGVIHFIENNPDLEYLNIGHIRNITTKTITAADEASKNRTNDTFLSIKTYKRVLQKALIKCQWLTYG